jgi:hypothetical protein
LPYLRQRTRWRATRKDREARWRGTPDGRILTVYRSKWKPGWCWCIGAAGLPPVFSPVVYRTRAEAKTSVMAAAGLREGGGSNAD